MPSPRLVLSWLLVALVVPSTAAAQRDAFLGGLVQFYQTLRGAYGDEGPLLEAHLEQMTAALVSWDAEIRDAESQLRPRLQGADVQTSLQVHAILASLYLDRGRLDDALREFEADIAIDPARPAFHLYTGLIHQAAGRSAEAADAFRAAWRLDPTDPQNAYRLVRFRSDGTTPEEIAQALATLARVEGELVRRERLQAESPFRTTRAIDDDTGAAMAFVPPLYTRAFELLLRGSFEEGLSALRGAVAADPLVAGAASRPMEMAQGIEALRQGGVEAAVGHLEAAVAHAGGSSEAHRVLGTAYRVAGDITRSLQHFGEATRLDPTDERSWLARARLLEETGESAAAIEVLRDAIAAVPDSGALRWRLRSARGERIDESDLELLRMADRLVLFTGRGALLGRLAAMAQGDLDYERGVGLLEERVALTPNNAAAHAALGQAYADLGREEPAYAELVTAFQLDSLDAGTPTALGRLHLAAGRAEQAIAVLERALVLDAGNSVALHALGSALVRAGRTDEGRQRLEESLRLQAADVEEQRSRRNAAMLSVQAEVHVARGEYDAAIDAWTDAMAIRSESVGHLQLSGALIAAGRLEEAASVMEAAIPLSSRPETHRRLAEVYAALGRTAESERHRRTYSEQRLEELQRGG